MKLAKHSYSTAKFNCATEAIYTLLFNIEWLSSSPCPATLKRNSLKKKKANQVPSYLVPALGVISNPAALLRLCQCRGRSPLLQRTETRGRCCLKSLICARARAHTRSGPGRLFGFGSSRFIRAFLGSPSKACCLNLVLKALRSRRSSLNDCVKEDIVQSHQ